MHGEDELGVMLLYSIARMSWDPLQFTKNLHYLMEAALNCKGDLQYAIPLLHLPHSPPLLRLMTKIKKQKRYIQQWAYGQPPVPQVPFEFRFNHELDGPVPEYIP